MAKAHLAPLTGLRFFAAGLVVLHHFGNPVLHANVGRVPMLGDVLINIQLLGFVGVDLFFVLSGFILAYTYVDDAGQLTVTRRTFWGARIARVYPLYLLAAFFALPPLFWHMPPHQALPVTLASTIVLLQSWLPFSATAWNPPGWSLGAEAFFYLTFPFLVPSMARRCGRRPFVWLGGLWFVGMVVPLWYTLSDPDGLHSTWVYSGIYVWREFIRCDPLFHLSTFLIGVVTARLFLARGAGPSDGRSWHVPAALLVLIGIMALGTNLPYMLVFDGGLSLLLALLIYGMACGCNIITTILGSAPLRLLGEASYAIYLLQFPLWQWAAHLLPHYFKAPGGYTTSGGVFGVYGSCLIVVSIIAHLTIERPLRRWLRRLLRDSSPLPRQPTELSRVA